MKKLFMIMAANFFLFTISGKESTINFNGSLETVFEFNHAKTYPEFPYYYSYKDPYTKDADYGEFSWGLKNLANLRFKARISDYLSFNLALNVHTYSGTFSDIYKAYYLQEAIVSSASAQALGTGMIDYRHGFFSIPFYYKSTYVGGFELERLSFKAGNEYFDIEAGLMRIARGYGYSFSPTDIFSPRNPLSPEARAEGKLAVAAAFYPQDLWKIQMFSVMPDNPVDSKGYGFKFGAATNFSVDKFNFEFMYSMFMPEVDYHADLKKYGLPETTNNDFTHVAGFSMKADVVVGLFIDMIYRFDQKAFWFKEYYGKKFLGYEGLEAAVGVDYTIPLARAGSIYLLLEYMFYGSGMLDWNNADLNGLYTSHEWWKSPPMNRTALIEPNKKPASFLRHDYIFGLIKWTVNDYVSIGTSYMFGADDQSSILTALVGIEPFQSFSINISAMYPFDWKMINKEWPAGEFGIANLGFYQKYQISVKVKF